MPWQCIQLDKGILVGGGDWQRMCFGGGLIKALDHKKQTREDGKGLVEVDRARLE